jgi:hypothetical protein
MGQVEELADLGSTLGTETLGDSNVSQAWDILFTLLDNHQREDSQVRRHNTTTDRLSLAFTSTTRTVARVALGQQQAHTVGQKDTLLHGETLLVVTARNTENVPLKFVTESIARDFLGHALVVKATARKCK